jgi:adenine-specific DNA-methyltransferase
MADGPEDPDYLQGQLITCLGNKRALLDLVGDGLALARRRLGARRLDFFDAFSGSGVVSRYFKRHARLIHANDLESYARVAAECFLANAGDLPRGELEELWRSLRLRLDSGQFEEGLFARLYAPKDDGAIQAGERVFYTRRNALYLDTARRLIASLPEGLRPFFLGPLLSEASVHANTSGVFKGFHKDSRTGIGKFGGRKGDALARILGDIELDLPVLSRFSCECQVHQGDASAIAERLAEVDIAYLDPPYNQHPYGSNYFMLNLLVDYKEPAAVSRVSGIPQDWRRSDYNKAAKAEAALEKLVERVKAKFVLVSFSSEGFIAPSTLEALLARHGRLEILERRYNAFRGSRNLRGRNLHLSERLYVLEKS